MSNKVLDNPIWNAMISGNSNLAPVNGYAKFFPEEIGPFAGLKKFDELSFQQLHEILPDGRVAVIFSAKHLEIPSYWKLKDSVQGLQMIFTGQQKPLSRADNVRAIDLYKHLGFSIRSEMNIKVIQK